MRGPVFALCLMLACTPMNFQSADDYDYTTIDEVLENQGNDGISFSELVDMLLSGKDFSSTEIWRSIGDFLLYTLNQNRRQLYLVIALTVFSVLFVRFTEGKLFGQVSVTGTYVTYLLLVTTLASAVGTAAGYTKTALENLCNFLTAFIPTYFLSVSFTSGAATAAGYYSVMSFILWAVEWGILHLLLPVVLFYIVIAFLNYLSEKDVFTKFAELFETVIDWSLKGGITVILGLQLVQGLITPYLNGMGVNAVKKVVSMIPGAGNGMKGAVELVLGAGLVVKNGIGTAGMIMLAVIMLFPFLQLLILTLMYYFTAAILQPLGEERFTECVSMTAKGISMMMKLTGYAGLLFFLSLAMMTNFTNLVF